MNTVRLVIAIICFAIGAIFCLISVLGVFRLKFALKRMHSAALADTCGLFFIVVGLMVLCGFTFMTLKLGLIVVVFWLTSPVSGHLIGNLVKNTMGEELEKNAKQKTLEK